MKHLKLFNQASEYEAYMGGEEVVLPNVSYIVEYKNLPVGDPRRVAFNPKPKSVDAKVGDIVVANSDGVKIIVNSVADIPSGYVPIGVVVIPTSHNVYGNGTCCVMSLNYMSYMTPDTGGTSGQNIRWGLPSKNVSLTDYDKLNYVGIGNTINTTVQGTNDYGSMPSDSLTAVTGLDGVSNYYKSSTSKRIPSPYNADGSRNEAYYTTEYSAANALSDFAGKENTKVLTDLMAVSDWKTASSINNLFSAGHDYPAAACCWRYSTIGTNQGDWYFPACGELGYICNRQATINATLQSIIDAGLTTRCSVLNAD